MLKMSINKEIYFVGNLSSKTTKIDEPKHIGRTEIIERQLTKLFDCFKDGLMLVWH